MTESEFLRQSQSAIERMREMNSRSQIANNSPHKMPPAPSFVKINENRNTQNQHSRHTAPINDTQKPQNPSPPPKATQTQRTGNGLNIPFLDNILKDGDSTLILGLLLVLMSENSDKMLLFALMYILM